MTEDAWAPSAADLPREIAVFPLTGALLLPFGRLPLNIFEPRYLAMVQDSLGQGRMFGMIQPNAGEAAGPNGPGLFRIGCLGRVSSFSETDDGRFLITLTGVARFAIVEELPLRHGYRRVRVDYTGFEADLDATRRPVLDRQRLEESLRGYFRANRIDANWDAVRETPDAMLVTTLAMVCPFEPREKQALLEAPTLQDRADMLLALVEIGAYGAPESEGGAKLS
jgi:Lon protease-like protein